MVAWVHIIMNIIVSGEAILSAENSWKPLVGAIRPSPAWGTYNASPDPQDDGDGDCCPLDPHEPQPALGLRSWTLMKNPGYTPLANHQIYVIN